MSRFLITAVLAITAFGSAHGQDSVGRLELSDASRSSTPPEWLAPLEQALRGSEIIDVLIEFRTDDTAPLQSVESGRPNATPGREASDYAAALQRQIEPRGRALATDLTAAGVDVVQSFAYQPIVHARISAEQLESMMGRPDIVAIRLNQLMELKYDSALRTERALVTQASNDRERPLITNTTGYINADDAWAKGFRGQGYAIAILDDGINANHELFKSGKILTAACFSDGGTTAESLCPGGTKTATGIAAASACPGGNEVCYHGSHVAGIAAGNNTPASFIRQGVAPDAKLIPIQVFHRRTSATVCKGSSSCLRSSTSDLVAALDWLIANGPARNLVSVNMSLGGGEYANYCDSETALTAGINTLRAMGILTAIAAGNEGLSGKISHPACIRNAVAVSSVIITIPETDHNHAAIVDLLAPGFLVNSASNAGPTSYVTYTGTSMATPHVAGAIAVLKSKQASATADQLEFALKVSGPLATWPTWTWSTPRIDVNAALDSIGQTPPPSGIALMNFLPASDDSGFAYIRLANPSAFSGSATLALFQDVPKKALGKYTTTVPARSAKQIRISEIETALGSSAAADTFISVYVDSSFRGYAQNIVWNAEGQSLTNLTTCRSSLTDPVKFAGNTHTSLINGYISYLFVHNLASTTAKATLDIYDSVTGSFIGAVNTADIPGNTTNFFPVQDAFNAIGFQPSSSQFHANFVLRTGFNGLIQHVVDNEGSGVVTDMTPKCPI